MKPLNQPENKNKDFLSKVLIFNYFSVKKRNKKLKQTILKDFLII
jgi:hypothetical protein